MKFMQFWWCLIVLATGALGLPAYAELPPSVASALKNAGIPKENVAVFVQAVEGSSPILSHNADKSMNPASVMKLVTTNAALDLLTPSYRWKTEVYRDGTVTDGVLQGNLIIKGYGDPSFKAQDFWRMLMSVQQTGITKIQGDLVLDKSYFAQQVGPRKTFDDETWRAYNAEPSALLVNGRNTSFKFIATESEVNVSQEFELSEIQIVNRMKPAKGACGEWRSRFGYTVTQQANGAVVTFNGTYAPDCGERYLELSVFDDEKYAFYTFKKLWRQLGGSFAGKLKTQDVTTQILNSQAVKILAQYSEPLAYVEREINKWSNNLMARQLLLTIGAEKSGAPASEAKGAAAIKDWLASKTLNGQSLAASELVIENGSGLSRIERINAQHLGRMLLSAYISPVMPEFMASMPILAQDGTIQKRLKESPVAHHAHLKTGSINGVSAIAGYVLDANNHRHVLVMMVNHANAGESKNAQDALIEWVHQQP